MESAGASSLPSAGTSVSAGLTGGIALGGLAVSGGLFRRDFALGGLCLSVGARRADLSFDTALESLRGRFPEIIGMEIEP